MATTIGKFIKKTLADDQTLAEYVGDRIYPVTCPDYDNVKAPYLIYWVDSINESWTKDGLKSDTCQVSIMVVAKDYDEKMEILPLVRTVIQNVWSEWHTDFRIADLTMTLGADEYDLEFGYHTSTFSYAIETEDL